MRAWHFNFVVSALGYCPDSILLAVVGLFRLFRLSVSISLLLLFHFFLHFFLLQLGLPIIFPFCDRLTFEKRLDVNTTNIFVHGTDLTSAHDFLELLFSQIYDDVLRLEVCVDDTTLAVKVVKANQDLLRHATNKWDWDPLVIVAFHYL